MKAGTRPLGSVSFKTMNVRLLFFGATADLAGERSVDLSLADSATVSDALTVIANGKKGFSSQKLLFAVNETYVTVDTKLEDGDDLAIFAPVSGG